MFDRYLIEIGEIEAGILIREGEAYAFHALASPYRGFEGARFPDPWSAERALRRHGARSNRPAANRRPLNPSRDEPPRDRSAS